MRYVLVFVIGLCSVLFVSVSSLWAQVAQEEGIPVGRSLESWSEDGGGVLTACIRSEPLRLLAYPDLRLLNDPLSFGVAGRWGRVTWLWVPEGWTITIFPGHVLDFSPGVIARIDQSFDTWLTDFLISHPWARATIQSQHSGRLENGQFVATDGYQEDFVPGLNCDPGLVEGSSIIEYRISFTGVAISDLPATFPPMMVYRVPVSW